MKKFLQRNTRNLIRIEFYSDIISQFKLKQRFIKLGLFMLYYFKLKLNKFYKVYLINFLPKYKFQKWYILTSKLVDFHSS